MSLLRKLLVFTLMAILSISCAIPLAKRKVSSLAKIKKHFEMVAIPGIKRNLRAGYFMEKDQLRGCVLYLEGLGDSIMNHTPFFTALTDAGYRVISFDYMGQGGSEGKMNDTRLSITFPPDATEKMLNKYEKREKYYEIGNQGNYIWNYFAGVKNNHGEDCNDSKKLVIGWSTGGLAAYKMANDLIADAVVLIAPGIHIKFLVGESAEAPRRLIFLQEVITERTLTRNKFTNTENPHVEKIKPTSPAHVPQFSGNLYLTSKESQYWKISKKVPGLVFLSGRTDTYVDRDLTTKTIKKNSSHFEVKSYEGALHELDNEIDRVTSDLYSETILFLNSQ